jgi:hypothetical protein
LNGIGHHQREAEATEGGYGRGELKVVRYAG